MNAGPTPTRVTAARLVADDCPPLPVVLELPGAGSVVVQRILRRLVARRVVAQVRWCGQDALLKLYASEASARRERRGLEWLQAAAVPSPRLLHAGARALLLEWLPGVCDFRACWHAAAGEEARLQLLAGALGLLQRMHAVGLHQRDLHPGNLLCAADGRMWIVDGAGIARAGWLRRGARDRANLALFLSSSLLPTERGLLERLRERHPGLLPAAAALAPALSAWDRARARLRARKSLRDGRQYRVERGRGRLLVLRRDREDAPLRALLADPRVALAAGAKLKAGHSATVVRVRVGTRELVLKHYHRPRLLPAWLWPSRARCAWQNCARLSRTGIAGPRALALLEQRYAARAGESWLVYEYTPGETLLAHCGARAPEEEVARQVGAFFGALEAIGCSHGDCKASNFIVDDGTLRVVDLDAMRAHRWQWSLSRALKRDRARFLANFSASLRARLEREFASG